MSSIAILIPTKNRLNLLKRALDSVFKQMVLPDEIVIINDGSTDNTEKFLNDLSKRYSIVKVLHRSKSGGVNVARNQGTKITESDFVVRLDDDDELFPEAIERVKKRVETAPENYNVFYFNTVIDNGSDKFVGGFQFRRGEDFYDPSYEDVMTKFNLKRDCKAVFRQSLFKNSKYFAPESVNGFESYTMKLIAKDRKGIRYYPETAILVHQDKNIPNRLSIRGSKDRPWQMFILHFKQIFQHWKFYLSHPKLFLKKIVEMIKLFVRSVIKIFV